MTIATRIWLAWAGLSTVVAVGSAYAVGILIRTSIETGVVLFGIGLAWSAATPAVLKLLIRKLR